MCLQKYWHNILEAKLASLYANSIILNLACIIKLDLIQIIFTGNSLKFTKYKQTLKFFNFTNSA